jgi:23S rRNA (adenine2503-C2)-methyltransferase
MDLDVLQATLDDLGEPSFRTRQVWRWVAQGAPGYEAMTDLPKRLRATLDERVPFSTLTVENETQSQRDGTVKVLFRTADGRPVEAVLMRYQPDDARAARPDDSGAARLGEAGGRARGEPEGDAGRRAGGKRAGRRSVCLSSQSGCPLTCTFCATGQMRFGRNLTASEIVDQALHFRRMAEVDHAAFMGMGEPMMNLDAVLGACDRLPDIGITSRRTAISTVGWIPGIDRLANDPRPIRLALSLHVPEPALRSELMPVNDRYPLAEVLDACTAYYARKRRKVFVEYVMLAGINDSRFQAVQLAEVLGRAGRDIYKVNLIPYNPTGSGFEGSTPKAIDAFRAELERRGLRATVRLTRGRDIDAACGQLAASRMTRARPD